LEKHEVNPNKWRGRIEDQRGVDRGGKMLKEEKKGNEGGKGIR